MSEENLEKPTQNSEEDEDSKESHWPRILFYTYLHILALYGIILMVTEASFLTIFFTLTLIWLGIIGVSAGAHRLWAHHSYTAATPLKLFLMLCQTLVGQGSIYDWVLYHRLHHKHFETEHDPFNPCKGFLHAHFLCLTTKPTPEEEKLAEEIDMSDLEEDSIVMFQKKHYWLLYTIICLVLPIYIPFYYLGESILPAGFVSGFMRYAINLHLAWLIHSATRIFGLQKGEKYPPDTNVVFLFYKTYWLQYHYLAPWDYQTGEYGKYGSDWISAFIRVCAALDLATDLRTVDSETVKTALSMSLETNKPIPQCLLEVEENANIPKDHYLEPKKYY